MAYGTVQADVIGTSVANSNLGAGNASIMKNRIINGAMVIDQRNAGASVTPADTYTLDRFLGQASQASKYSVQQNAGSVTPPAGFKNYLGVTSLSAYSVGASDYFNILQPIEGYNVADLGWGTASAKTVTLSFQVYSSLTGTFGGSLSNGAGNRSYPFTYSIPVANTWTSVSITVAGDTSGTWLTTNGIGLRVYIGLGAGATYSGTAGAWAGSFFTNATGATSVVGTSGATFYITGVQLEVGSSATGYEYRQYGQELALCRRYACLAGDGMSGVGRSTTQMLFSMSFPQQMRVAPTASLITSSLAISDNYVADFTSSGSTVDLTNTTPYGGRVSVNGFTGLTQGRWYAALNNTANNGAFLLFSAEL